MLPKGNSNTRIWDSDCTGYGTGADETAGVGLASKGVARLSSVFGTKVSPWLFVISGELGPCQQVGPRLASDAYQEQEAYGEKIAAEDAINFHILRGCIFTGAGIGKSYHELI